MIYPKSKMAQHNPSGMVEANIHGGERIFSRIDTKQIVELSKSAKTDEDYKALGRFVFDAMRKQDSSPKEYK
jgi:hypothetical protein